MSDEAKEKPNYYAILPAVVRYDERLSSTAKLLYAELTALANKEGYAWASNRYLAGLFGVGPRTITRILTRLAEVELITVEYTTSNRRKVFMVFMEDVAGGIDKNVYRGIDKNVQTLSTKMSRGIDKNVHHNTKTKNIKKRIISQELPQRDLVLAKQKMFAMLEFVKRMEHICEAKLFTPSEKAVWYYYRVHLAKLGPDWLEKATKKLSNLVVWRNSKPDRTTTDIKRAFGAWMGRVAGYKKKDIA